MVVYLIKRRYKMFNKENVLATASRSIGNCIYNVYGGIGYFTDIINNCFSVDIYDSPSRVINKMNNEESKKHLLKSIKVEFEDLNDSVSEFRIIDSIVSKIESVVYNS